MVNCTYDPSNTVQFPFEYLDATGATVTQGRLVDVPGFTDPVCIFEQAACQVGALPHKPDGSTFACCSASSNVEDAANMWYVPMIAFYGGILSFFALSRAYTNWQTKRGNAPKDGGATAGMRSLRLDTSGMSKCQKWTLLGIFLLTIVALVAESSVMPTSIQQTLTPTEGSARLAMAAFLTPVKEVFSFLEDAMVVKVGYALAAGRLTELNHLLHVSVLGGLVSGALAFVVMLGLALNDSSAEALLNPSAASNQGYIEDGCTLIPTSEELLSHARVFWILQALAWIPQFTSMGVSGFLAGTGQVAVYLFPMIVSATVPIALWFGLLPTAQSATAGLTPLSALGIAYGVGPWIVGVFFVVFLLYRGDLRRKYRLRCLCCARPAPTPVANDPGGGISTTGELCSIVRDVASEGLQLMVVDLAVQASLTVTVYVAAKHDFATAYKLAAAQAAYWTFGPAYLVGLMLFVKISGSQLLASGKHKEYVRGLTYVAWVVGCVSVSALVAAWWKHQPIAFNYGETACEFAAQEECAGAYATIFQGEDSLSHVFEAFGPTIGLNMAFMLLRAALSTCHDFWFMARASVVTLVCVYIPVVVLVSKVFPESLATGYYIAMYAPHFAMVIVFGVRMRTHAGNLFTGKPGPWTPHMAAMSMRLSGAYHALSGGQGSQNFSNTSLLGARGSVTSLDKPLIRPRTASEAEMVMPTNV